MADRLCRARLMGSGRDASSTGCRESQAGGRLLHDQQHSLPSRKSAIHGPAPRAHMSSPADTGHHSVSEDEHLSCMVGQSQRVKRTLRVSSGRGHLPGPPSRRGSGGYLLQANSHHSCHGGSSDPDGSSPVSVTLAP